MRDLTTNRRDQRITTVALNLVFAIAMPAIQAAPGFAESSPDTPIEIPLDVTTGRPQIDVTINGEGPYPFVLDTGSTLTVFDAALARELGLEVIGEREIGAPGMPQVPAEIVRAGELEVHGVRLENEEMVTIDLAGMSGGLFLGVLRFSAFADQLATLDLHNGSLILSTGALEPSSPGTVAFATDEGIIDLPISVGGHEMTAHLDTGSPGGVTVPARLAEQLTFVGELTPAGNAKLVGGGGSVSRGQLDGVVELGSIRLENPEVMVVDLPIPKVNLGNRLIRDYRLQIDQRHGLVRFEAAAPSPTPTRTRVSPTEGRRLGLRPQPGPPAPNGLPMVDGGLPIGGVDPDSLAMKAGLRAGDLLLTVNGTKMADFTMPTLVALFGGSEPLTLEVRRADSAEVEVLEIP